MMNTLIMFVCAQDFESIEADKLHSITTPISAPKQQLKPGDKIQFMIESYNPEGKVATMEIVERQISDDHKSISFMFQNFL